MDEQKPLAFNLVPIMTQERFAELTGLTPGQVRGMVEKGHLPSVKVGGARPRFVNLLHLNKEVYEAEDWS
ncbi:MerR family transcriptional regulator [Mangrovitalea sediminis]|uniref:hypothetical protein n=1 Tax=Mangrovitalea sediminis TaxID=1982043 RepID=UPI000BE5D4AE|nr:hypothetical protein [Mangrovitalea sediminis]